MTWITYETLYGPCETLGRQLGWPVKVYRELDPVPAHRLKAYLDVGDALGWDGLWDDNGLDEEGILRFSHPDMNRGFRMLIAGDNDGYHKLKNGFVERNSLVVSREGLR